MTSPTSIQSINDRFPVRCSVFIDEHVREVLAATYGCERVSLDLVLEGRSIEGFRARRLHGDRLMLAPFNFQPVLRDHGSDIASALIARAQRLGPRTSAVIRLHHALPAHEVSRLDLAQTSESVETLLDLRGAGAFGDALPKEQRRKLRRSLASAERSGVNVRKFADAETMRAFYDVLVRTYRDKHHMLPQPLQLFLSLLALPAGSSSCYGFVAETMNDKRIVGGIFLICDDVQCTYAWGANDESFKSLGLGTLLLGSAIGEAAERGIPVFSFGASPVTHTSLRSFKRQWGGEEHPIVTYYWRERPREIDLHEGFKVARAGLAYAPLWLIKLASPLAVRWLV